jgi:hypothetical protein
VNFFSSNFQKKYRFELLIIQNVCLSSRSQLSRPIDFDAIGSVVL